NEETLNQLRDDITKVTIQGGIAGGVLFFLGLFLCFFGAFKNRYKGFTIFVIGFYFFANLAYIGMVNG
ncbi:hypothetical protein BGZ65_008622, partial [Modicella reniformis]